MKTYFVVSDIHSFYSILIRDLEKNGFDTNNKNHFLIILGDLFDRGEEPQEIINFINSIKDRCILIRGNHEDLMDDLIERGCPISIDYHNGTYDTIKKLFNNKIPTIEEYHKSSVYDITHNMLNYYETDNYIFTHGFIPLKEDVFSYLYNKDWRVASLKEWVDARWYNGIAIGEQLPCYKEKIKKTIVVGHFKSSYGHERFNDDFSNNHNIFYGKNIIALDATTVLSRKINVLVLKEEEL